MHNLRRTTFGIWGIAIIIVMRLFILYFTYHLIKNNPVYDNVNVLAQIFNNVEIIILSVLFAELIVYWVLISRPLNILWVKLHVWLTFIVLVVIPLVYASMIYFFASRWGLDKITNFIIQFQKIRLYLFWGLVITANVFFLSNIAKAIRTDRKTDNDTEPPGVLDEFVD